MTTEAKTPRRKRGEGTAPRWTPARKAFRVRLPRAAGQRWQQDVYVKGTGPDDKVAEAEAWKVLRRELHRRDLGGGGKLDRRTTVGAWVARYPDELATNLRPESRRQYRALSRHLVRELGRIRLVDLRSSDVAAMMARLESRGMSANRRYATLNVLRLALDAAVNDERLARNVARMIEPPTRTKAMIRPPSGDDVSAILDHVRSDPVYGAMYAVTAAAGLREAEVLGLRWADVVGNRLVVDAQLAYKTDDRVAPKSESGRRIVPLPAWVVEALAERRRWQLADGSTGDAGLVFTTPSDFPGSRRPAGSPMRASAVWSHLKRVCRELGIRSYRWHDFRHAAATRMLARGVDVKVVQRTMGHATIATTAQYLHTDADDETIAGALDPVPGEARPARFIGADSGWRVVS